jgi:hypothetical protein
VRKERGSVTAELVLLFPVVALLVGVLCWLGAAQAQRISAVQAASQLVRAAAIDETKVPLLAARLGVGYKTIHPGALVCVRVSKKSRSIWLGSLPIEHKACARKEGK